MLACNWHKKCSNMDEGDSSVVVSTVTCVQRGVFSWGMCPCHATKLWFRCDMQKQCSNSAGMPLAFCCLAKAHWAQLGSSNHQLHLFFQTISRQRSLAIPCMLVSCLHWWQLVYLSSLSTLWLNTVTQCCCRIVGGCPGPFHCWQTSLWTQLVLPPWQVNTLQEELASQCSSSQTEVWEAQANFEGISW